MTIKNKPTRWQTSLLKGDAGCGSWRSISMWFWKRESLDVLIFSLVGCCDITQERCKKREIQFVMQQKKQTELHEEPFLLISGISLRNVLTMTLGISAEVLRCSAWTRHNFTNLKKDLRKLLAFRDYFSRFKTRMLLTYNQCSSGRNCSASSSFHFSYVRSQLANKISWLKGELLQEQTFCISLIFQVFSWIIHLTHS